MTVDLHVPLKILTMAILLSLMLMQNAHAYIDPGSGSAIVSIIIGFFVGCGLVLKSFWYKIKRVFGRSRKDQ